MHENLETSDCFLSNYLILFYIINPFLNLFNYLKQKQKKTGIWNSSVSQIIYLLLWSQIFSIPPLILNCHLVFCFCLFFFLVFFFLLFFIIALEVIITETKLLYELQSNEKDSLFQQIKKKPNFHLI